MGIKDRFGKASVNHFTGNTWQDDTKEQIHLGMGSAEYRERCEDLSEHQPFKEDDPFHQQLEAHNAELDAQRRSRLVKEHKDVDVNQKIDRKLQKQYAYKSVRREAQKQATLTPQKDDDIRATQKQPIPEVKEMVEDNSVSQEYFVPKSVRRVLEG